MTILHVSEHQGVQLADYGHRYRYVLFVPGGPRDHYLSRARALRRAFHAKQLTAGEYARELCLAVDLYVLEQRASRA